MKPASLFLLLGGALLAGAASWRAPECTCSLVSQVWTTNTNCGNNDRAVTDQTTCSNGNPCSVSGTLTGIQCSDTGQEADACMIFDSDLTTTRFQTNNTQASWAPGPLNLNCHSTGFMRIQFDRVWDPINFPANPCQGTTNATYVVTYGCVAP